MSLFLVIFLSLPVADVLWWWWADRAVRTLPRAKLWRTLVALFCALQLVGYLWVVGSRFALPWGAATMPTTMLATLFLWHLLIVPLVAVVMLIGTLTRGASQLIKRKSPGLPPPAVRESEGGWTRRDLLKAAAVAAPPILTAGAVGTSLFQLHHFRVNRITIPLVDLPPDLDGLTIAQVSDIHVGRFTRGRLLAQIADATNALRADLVLMTGDLIDFSLRDLPAGLDLVRTLDPRHGLFMIEGNHDLFEDRIAFENGVKAAGVPLLLNETATARVRGHDVQLLGIKWGGVGARRAAQWDVHLDTTLPQLHRGDGVFPILLAHHPHAFDRAAAAGIPLTLAGHTHGGQLMLTDHLGPGPWMFKYWSGLYRRGSSALVVSNGVGNWFPLRINAPAEIVHITLRSVK
jgi:predicted MPP superfamily phosphohydrolase